MLIREMLQRKVSIPSRDLSEFEPLFYKTFKQIVVLVSIPSRDLSEFEQVFKSEIALGCLVSIPSRDLSEFEPRGSC